MTVLTTAQRNQVKRSLMRYWSQNNIAVAFGKPNLDTNIGAADDWLDARKGATAPDTDGFNATLSGPFKTNGTDDQKDLLISAIEARRVSIDLLRALLGQEVD